MTKPKYDLIANNGKRWHISPTNKTIPLCKDERIHAFYRVPYNRDGIIVNFWHSKNLCSKCYTQYWSDNAQYYQPTIQDLE